jgi:hypothetical protein
MASFEIQDCTLLINMGGIPAAFNLRELRDRIAICGVNVLYHHFCETLLRPTFDNPDYRNDFAVWVKLHLGDRVLAERLGILDPYSYRDMEELRGATLELLDERLSELTSFPFVPQGAEFFFMEATTVVFDTGERIDHPRQLSRALGQMTTSSIYFHFLEARRRPPVGMDDFSAWLCGYGTDFSRLVEKLSSIDTGFYTLTELRNALAAVVEQMGDN